MTSAPTLEMAAGIILLGQRGFVATTSYGDGVLRMAKTLPSGDQSVAWLTEDGIVRAPHLMSDYRAAARRRIEADSLDLNSTIC